jgi:glycosyltransferase involved in cell wall biosynthesis
LAFTSHNYTLPTFSRSRSPFSPALNMVRVMFEIVQLVRKEQIGLIHANSAVAGVHALPAAMLLRVPCVVHAHDFQTAQTTNRLLKLLLRYRRSTIVFVSNALRKHYNMAPERAIRSRTIYNGIDVSKFFPDTSARVALTRRYGLPATSFIIGSVGRIEPRKGLAQVVEALAIVAGTYPHVRFLVVGETPVEHLEWKERLIDRIAELQLGDKIVFAGFRSDMASVVPSFDVLAACATGDGGEAFPLNVLEAMACGRPVIAVPQGGVVEQIVDGENGFLVPNGDIAATADALARLIKHPELGQRMGESGRRTVEQHFRVEHQVQAIEQLYDEMLGDNGRWSAPDAPVISDLAERIVEG